MVGSRITAAETSRGSRLLPASEHVGMDAAATDSDSRSIAEAGRKRCSPTATPYRTVTSGNLTGVPICQYSGSGGELPAKPWLLSARLPPPGLRTLARERSALSATPHQRLRTIALGHTGHLHELHSISYSTHAVPVGMLVGSEKPIIPVLKWPWSRSLRLTKVTALLLDCGRFDESLYFRGGTL
jgi:hypothetical protein